MGLEDIMLSEISQKEKGAVGPKMAEDQDGKTTVSPTNSSKEHLNAEQTPQNNF